MRRASAQRPGGLVAAIDPEVVDRRFVDRVFEVVRAIPEGLCLSYSDVAMLAGSSRAARAVGQALRSHVGDHDGLPWHRVIRADGSIAQKGDLHRATLQRALLAREGVEFGPDARLDWGRHRADLGELLRRFGCS